MNLEGDGGTGGGTATTAGNLVLQVIKDGRFRAISAEKGDVLYRGAQPRAGMRPPITYEADGEASAVDRHECQKPARVVDSDLADGRLADARLPELRHEYR